MTLHVFDTGMSAFGVALKLHLYLHVAELFNVFDSGPLLVLKLHTGHFIVRVGFNPNTVAKLI
jgi:hypothetical protein